MKLEANVRYLTEWALWPIKPRVRRQKYASRIRRKADATVY